MFKRTSSALLLGCSKVVKVGSRKATSKPFTAVPICLRQQVRSLASKSTSKIPPIPDDIADVVETISDSEELEEPQPKRKAKVIPLPICLKNELEEERLGQEADQDLIAMKRFISQRYKIHESPRNASIVCIAEERNERITVRWSCQGDQECPSLYDEYHPNFEEDYFNPDHTQYLEGTGIAFTVEIAKKNKGEKAAINSFPSSSSSSGRYGRLINKGSQKGDTGTTTGPETEDEASTRDRVVIQCVAGQSIHLLSVRYLPKGSRLLKKSDGSSFEINHDNFRLDSQRAVDWKEYLADRGIDSHFANFILAMANEKESKEYSVWLSDILDFVSTSNSNK